jgi:hypothetical protein
MTTSRDMAMGRTLLRLYMREMARANQKEEKRKKRKDSRDTERIEKMHAGKLTTHILQTSPVLSSTVSSLSGEKWPQQLLRDTHVGKAMPFSTFLPCFSPAAGFSRLL